MAMWCRVPPLFFCFLLRMLRVMFAFWLPLHSKMRISENHWWQLQQPEVSPPVLSSAPGQQISNYFLFVSPLAALKLICHSFIDRINLLWRWFSEVLLKEYDCLIDISIIYKLEISQLVYFPSHQWCYWIKPLAALILPHHERRSLRLIFRFPLINNLQPIKQSSSSTAILFL